MQLRAKEYFDQRATEEMTQNLKPQERTVQEKLAYACRILAMTGQEAGLAGQIAFVHPRACCGVLVELATPSPAGAADVPAPVRLKRLVVGASDVRRASDVLRSLFGLEEVAMNGGPRSMLAVGRGALLVVPSEEVGGTEGLVALSMLAEDFSALTEAFTRAGTSVLRGTGEITVQPSSSHGVNLHISRY